VPFSIQATCSSPALHEQVAQLANGDRERLLGRLQHEALAHVYAAVELLTAVRDRERRVAQPALDLRGAQPRLGGHVVEYDQDLVGADVDDPEGLQEGARHQHRDDLRRAGDEQGVGVLPEVEHELAE